MSVLGESLGEIETDCLNQTAATDMGHDRKQAVWRRIGSCSFIWLDFHSWGWCAVLEDERLRKIWTDNRRQLKSFTLSIISTSSFNDQRNYVASSKYLDKILNSRYLLMCQSKSVQSTTFETTFEELQEKCVFHMQVPLKKKSVSFICRLITIPAVVNLFACTCAVTGGSFSVQKSIILEITRWRKNDSLRCVSQKQ